jgi:hypothetical protein
MTTAGPAWASPPSRRGVREDASSPRTGVVVSNLSQSPTLRKFAELAVAIDIRLSRSRATCSAVQSKSTA